jgi:hypothetical protein
MCLPSSSEKTLCECFTRQRSLQEFVMRVKYIQYEQMHTYLLQPVYLQRWTSKIFRPVMVILTQI